ncbi:MAG: hypothetical protein IAX21_01460 [Candidatus Bathyarchaeota archaeon]|nr:MAG: hypothetical protein NUK63_04335 [Candidatus Bathyarchaeum tardum]WNZ29566.1 MAG: hypothetical protein IAX21_01460 [Candidatus Bathyarchaeota archaeon]
MVNARNKVAAFLAIVAGTLLIISGQKGPTGTYDLIIENLTLMTQNQLIIQIIQLVELIFITITVLGGFIVILGGYLLIKNKTRSAKLLIALGTGFGIISLIFLMLTLFQTQDLMTTLSRHTLLEWIAITLSFTARFIAK